MSRNNIYAMYPSGYPGLRFRAEGPTATAPETHDQEEGPSSHSHPVPVEVLRRRPPLHVARHLEDTPGGAAFAPTVSTNPILFFNNTATLLLSSL